MTKLNSIQSKRILKSYSFFQGFLMKFLGLFFALIACFSCGSQDKDGGNQSNLIRSNQPIAFLDIKPTNGFVKKQSIIKGKTIAINGTVVEIGTLGGTDTFIEQENNGYVVGGSNIPMPIEEVEGDEVTDLTVHAFVHKDGVIKDLGTLGGAYSSSSSVNSTGVVVGGSQLTDASYQAFRYENNAMIALPNLSGGNHSWAYSINNDGYIVGEAKNASGAFKAVLWQNGVISELNSLLPANSGWDLTSAKSISHTGLVSGVGRYNGQKTFFQLTLNITE